MPFNNAAMVIAANSLRTACTYGQLHSAASNAAGTTNVCTGARQPITWSAATADGDFGLSASLNFTGIVASGAVFSITLWSAVTSGTIYGEFTLTGDATANAAGEYTVTALNLNGSST